MLLFSLTLQFPIDQVSYYLESSPRLDAEDMIYGARVLYSGGSPRKAVFDGVPAWVLSDEQMLVDVANEAYPDVDSDGRSEDRWVMVSLKVFMLPGFSLKVRYFDGTSEAYALDGSSSDSSPDTVFDSYYFGDWRMVTFVAPYVVFCDHFSGADFKVEVTGTAYIAEIYVSRLVGYFPHRKIESPALSELPFYTPQDKILIVSNFFAAWWNFKTGGMWYYAEPPYYDANANHPPDWKVDNPKAADYCPYSTTWWAREIKDLKEAGIDVFLPNFCGMTHDQYYALALQTMNKAMDSLVEEGWNWDVLPHQDEQGLPRVGQFLETYFKGEHITANNEMLDLSTLYGRVFLLTELRRFWFQIPSRYWAVFKEGGYYLLPVYLYYEFSITGGLTKEDMEWIAREFSKELVAIGMAPSLSQVGVYIAFPWNAFWDEVGGNFYENLSGANLLAEKWGWGLGQLWPPDFSRYTLSVGPGYNDSLQPTRTNPIRDRAWGEWYRIGYDVNDNSEKGMWNKVLRTMFESGGYSPTASSFVNQKSRITIITWNELLEGSSIEDTLEWGKLFIQDTMAYNALFKKGFYKFTDDSDFDITSDLGADIYWVEPSSLTSLKIPAGGWALLRVGLTNNGKSAYLAYSKRNKGLVSLDVDNPSSPPVPSGEFYIPGNMGPYDSAYNPRGKAIIPILINPQAQGNGTWAVYVNVDGVGNTLSWENLTFTVSTGSPNPAHIPDLTVSREPGKLVLNWGEATGGDNPVRGYRVYLKNEENEVWRFTDDFDGSKKLGWDEMFGKWWIEDGSYRVRVRGSYEYFKDGDPALTYYSILGSYFGGSDWSNYVLDLDLNIRLISEDWRDGAWIGFRWKDPGNHYVLALVRGGGYGEEELHVYKVKDWSVVWDEATTPVRVSYRLHRNPDYYWWTPLYQGWHHLRIKCSGNKFTIEIDGEEVASFEDSDPIDSGGIVLGARRYSRAGGYTEIWYDNFELKLFDPPEWVYAGFTKSTSISVPVFDNLKYDVKVVPLDCSMTEGSAYVSHVDTLGEMDKDAVFLKSAENANIIVAPRSKFLLPAEGSDFESWVEIYSLSGVLVSREELTKESTAGRWLHAPDKPGMYILVIHASSGNKLYRLLVVGR